MSERARSHFQPLSSDWRMNRDKGGRIRLIGLELQGLLDADQ